MKYSFLLILLILLITGQSRAQNDEAVIDSIAMPWDHQFEGTQREFRGHFPFNEHDVFRINFIQKDTLLKGVIQQERRPQITHMEGTLYGNGNFSLYELNSFGNRSGAFVKGQIEGNTMSGRYVKRGREVMFEFYEIDLTDPPEFRDGTAMQGLNNIQLFRDVSSEFSQLELPTPIIYDEDAPRLENAGIFMDKPIIRFGSSQTPILLVERVNIIERMTKQGKFEFPNGNTGFVIQAYFDAGYDGLMYECYTFVFDPNGEFLTAFVVYSAQTLGRPILSTRLSVSLIFTIKDLGQKFNFKIDEFGSYRLLDH